MARVRVRQHVNPLSQKFQIAITPPEWETIYANLSQPFFLDIGSARGRFLLEMAKLKPEYNFLGLEIRQPLVEQANAKRDELGLTNLHFLFCHVNISLDSILSSLPKDCLQFVAVQFPDPWFKKRHAKRRMVKPELVNTLAEYLQPKMSDKLSGVFLQSDVQFIAQEMSSCFQAHPAFEQANPFWLPENPLPVATQREVATLANEKPVYRTLFYKKPLSN